MNDRFFLLCCSLLLFATSSFGQVPDSGSIPPPKAPPVADPKPGTSWEIQIEHHGNKSPVNSPSNETPPVHALSIHCERGRDLTHTIVLWSDGSKWDGYIKGNRAVQKNPTSGKISSLFTGDDDYLYPYFVKGFAGTAWITLEQYRSIEKIGKTICYKFVRPPGMTPFSVNGDTPLPELTAWIAVDGHVPVRIELGDNVYVYSSLQPINPQLEVPPDIVKFFAQVSLEENSLEIMRRNNRN